MGDKPKTTGGILRDIRQGCGHNLVDRSARTGRGLMYVSRVERDRVELDDEYLAYLAAFGRAYNVEVTAARFHFAGQELFTLVPMTVTASIPAAAAAPEPITPAADMAAVLSSLFPDGPAVLSIGDDEGDE